MNILEKLAKFTAELTYNDLTPNSITQAKNCFLDTYGVAIMGSKQEDACKLLKSLTTFRSGTKSNVWGTDVYLDPAGAALINAFAGHVYDFDDSCYAGMTHPSTVIMPAIIALAEQINASGKDIICGFIAGWEVSGRLGLSLPKLFNQGWHCSSLFGSIGATAACARVMRLSATETMHAMSLVICQVGGLREANGTKGKPFTLAKASENAVTACLAAHVGITGSPLMLEGTNGYFNVFTKNTQDISVFETIGNPLIMDSHGVCVKKYPICSSVHSVVESATALQAQHGLTMDSIKSIHCNITNTALQYLIYPEPQNATQAQFSIPYLIAVCFIDGKFQAEKHLTDACINDPYIKMCLKKITWQGCTELGPNKYTEKQFPESSELIITTDNDIFSHYTADPQGFPMVPFSREQLIEKFQYCTDNIISQKNYQNFTENIFLLEDMDMGINDFFRMVD